MKVHIRKRKGKKTNTSNLYLEIYRGYTLKPDGTTRANRERTKLDYFLYDNPKSPTERSHNKLVNRQVEAIKGEKLKELLNGKYGFKSQTKGKVNFIEYFDKLCQKRYESKGNYGNWDSVLKHLEKYCGVNVAFESIDIRFCEGFKDYLQNKAKTKSGKNLSHNSVNSYFCKLRASLNEAVEEGIIRANPSKKVSIPKTKQNKREFLTEEEIVKLNDTECRYDVLKRAFLFSCLTGLRWSDIHNLEWKDVRKEDDNWKIVFTQKKTKDLQYHYINKKAKEFLGEPVEGHKRVFVGLRYSSYMNTALSQWMLRAGITKDITFHCARHSYATLLLTKGTDLFTVSKLLGHSEIRTTQIYANIIDQKKIDAVNTLDIL